MHRSSSQSRIDDLCRVGKFALSHGEARQRSSAGGDNLGIAMQRRPRASIRWRSLISPATRVAVGAATAVLVLSVSVPLSCTRSALRIGGSSDGAAGATAAGGNPPVDGGVAGGGGGASPVDPVDCVLAQPRTMVQPAALDRQDRDLHTPSLVVNDPGDGASGRLARVVAQAVTNNMAAPSEDGIETELLDVDPSAGGELVNFVLGPTLLAPQTWTYAQMAPSHRTRSQVALAYNGGPGVVQLRTLAIPTWSPGPVVDVWLTNGTPLAMASGQGVGEMGIGYDGYGYGMAWDEATDLPAATVLSEDGEVVIGPHPILGATPVPDASDPAMAWSGEAYLIATTVGQCAVAEPLCVDSSVVISRVRPASGDAWDDSGIDLVASIETLPGTAWRGNPSMASFQDHTAVAWAERADTDEEPTAVRIAVLAPDGQVAGAVRTVTTAAAPTSGLRLSASPLGFLLIWPEDGDQAAADDQIGRSRLVVHHFAFDLEPRGAARVVQSTRFSSYGLPPAAGVLHPRGVLLIWSSRSMTTTRQAASVTWVDCVDR